MAGATTGHRANDGAKVLAARTAAAFGGAGGLATLAIVPLAWDTPGFNGQAVALLALVALAVAPTLVLLAPRLTWRNLYTVILAFSLVITAGVYFTGPNQPFGAIFYLWLGLVAFMFFSRREAIAVTCVVGVEYALLLGLQQGHVRPAARWVFVMATLVLTGIVVDQLLRRSEALAEAERAARRELEAAQSELAALNRTLEERVHEQVVELDGLGGLRRFLSPHVADVVISSAAGGTDLLKPHRRLISVFFCDLRGFTSFSASVEPEEVIGVLDEYYSALGQLIAKLDATMGVFQGDGLMAYFNDPVPCDDPGHRALALAVEACRAVGDLTSRWRADGRTLGLGIGLSLGYATLGEIGFEGRRDYGPVGTVVNLASRLCDLAAPGEILVDQRLRTAVTDTVELVPRGEFQLKGFVEPVAVFAVAGA